MNTTVLIAKHYPLERLALADLINRQVDDTRVVETTDLEAIHGQLADQPQQVLLIIDQGFSRTATEPLLQHLLNTHEQLKVLLTSDEFSKPANDRLADLGVSAWLSQKAPEQDIVRTVSRVLLGEDGFPDKAEPEALPTADALASLSAQETRILRKMCRGLMNKQIADQLAISIHTTKVHVSRILKKLGVRSRTQAVLLCRQTPMAAF